MATAVTKPGITKKKDVSSEIKKDKASSAESGIKYTDKSAGQPELAPIFENIKKLLLPYAKGTITITGGDGGQMSLVSKKAVEIEGRKKPELWFAGLLVQKGYVGFYFMPVYTSSEMKSLFEPELLKCLKGKSCFHIKKDDPVIYSQIADALKKGYEVYKQNGWV